MDYVEGRALSRVMQERGKPFDQADVVNWGIQLCDVLGYLHRRYGGLRHTGRGAFDRVFHTILELRENTHYVLLFLLRLNGLLFSVFTIFVSIH